MTDECYCDYVDAPSLYRVSRHKARSTYRCDECGGGIAVSAEYERAAMLYEGRWDVSRTCHRCLALRDYITAHAPCFCWLHGSLLDDAEDTLRQYGRESTGFWIGGMKRLLRAQRRFGGTVDAR